MTERAERKIGANFRLFSAMIFSACALMALSGCGHKHVWREATCTDPKMCVVCGVIRGEAQGHDWQKATCEKAGYCSFCGLTDETAPAKGHPSADKDGNCTECGKNVGIPLKLSNYSEYIDIYAEITDNGLGPALDINSAKRNDNYVFAFVWLTISYDRVERGVLKHYDAEKINIDTSSTRGKLCERLWLGDNSNSLSNLKYVKMEGYVIDNTPYKK